jgi:hypothetical protein
MCAGAQGCGAGRQFRRWIVTGFGGCGLLEKIIQWQDGRGGCFNDPLTGRGR